MTNLENIHYHIDQLAIESPEITALIARYTDLYRQDNRTVATLLQTLAEQDTFFVNLNLDAFEEAISTYKMPLAK